MPLYEYQCKECGRRTEKIQKFSDPELTTCPHCGGPLERTLTAPAVHFAGGGWYKDLYSSPKPAASSPEGGAATPAPAGGESAAAAPAASTPAASAPASSPAPAAAPAAAPSSPAKS